MPLSRVLGKVAGASKMQLVILDACRNNPFLAKMRQSGKSPRSIVPGLASIEPESGVLVAYAARDGTTALDGDDNSPYLEALVEAPRGAGAGNQPALPQGARRGLDEDQPAAGALHLRLAAAQPFFFRR